MMLLSCILMINHLQLSETQLHNLLKRGNIAFAGNRTLKIYGSLTCKSGKRMKKENRVFFTNEEDALANGFRPCGHCLNKKYEVWKKKHPTR